MRRLALVGALALAACAHQPPPPPPAEPVRPPPPEPPPDPDQGIQIHGDGTVDASGVDSAMSAHSRQLGECYQQGLKTFRYLGGEIGVKVRVNHEGHPLWVAPTRSIGNLAVDQCVLKLVENTTFPTPTGGNEAEFDWSVALHDAKARLQEWGADRVGDVFKKHAADLKACPVEKEPAGLRTVLFVGPAGKVMSVGVGADAKLDEAYAACLAGKIAKWKFPDPHGILAHVTYDLAEPAAATAPTAQ